MSRFGTPARIVAALAVCAALATLWIHGERERTRAAALEREIAALRSEGEAAERTRAALEAKLADLEATLAAQAREQASRPALAPGTSSAPAPADEAVARAQTQADDADDADETAPDARARGVLGALDEERLVAAGYARQDIDAFRARVDDLQLRRLYLRDRAAREGWIDTPRFAQESAALDAEMLGLRSEFDEGLYDWMLYAMGHPNRVAVLEVIPGSAGESAGLVRGDVIVRYDDRLMLSASDLRNATLEGRAGELVAIEVQRAGEPSTQRVFVPRGPMGIVLGATALEPAAGSGS